MSKKILGLDLGSNSIGWALLEEKDGKPCGIIDLGSRIFIKAVSDGDNPSPKNIKRRNARLARRVIQRRARRKSRMLNYLVSLNLLPKELQGNTQPEIILNELGDPYQLRAKALDQALAPYELGRVFLHLVQRRGFLSNRKTLLGDIIDNDSDLDVLNILNEMDKKEEKKATEKPLKSKKKAEEVKTETDFFREMANLRQSIIDDGCRTLGEYLSKLDHHKCKRNRLSDTGQKRTDRQMYRDELDLIWEEQKQYFSILTDDVNSQIEKIIFYQRPLKFKTDRVGNCSLEKKKKRALMAKLECQRFRYLQDINNLKYLHPETDKYINLTDSDRKNLIDLFEFKKTIEIKDIQSTLGLDKKTTFNLERGNKKFKGNQTAIKIREVLRKWNVEPQWDEMAENVQYSLVEDLLTIKKKSVLKKRLLKHWKYDLPVVIDLCLLEFESGHSSLSLKAIRSLMPYLEAGQIYSDARQSAGYGYEIKNTEIVDKLGMPPEIANPIVSKALHELRRVINALIAEYGKPDIIRIEMARDLEMNTTRYKENKRRQDNNTKSNDEAIKKFQLMGQKNSHLHLSKYPSHDDKIKYRIWKDQNEMCAYSYDQNKKTGKKIGLATLFTAEVDIDHIIPYSQSFDNSYMNKVVCFSSENQRKGQRTPIDAFGSNQEKWNQITQAIKRWKGKNLESKKARFYTTSDEIQDRGFLNSQLNDTRYISREALDYLRPLVGNENVTVTKGIMTNWLRHQWQLNNLIGYDRTAKDRVDHRHHTIDAVVTACIDRSFYNALAKNASEMEKKRPEFHVNDMVVDPIWTSLRDDLKSALDEMIVAHTPQRKLSDELHNVSGSSFKEGKGTVYRKHLADYFDPKCDTKVKAEKKLKSIVDATVAEILREHLAKYNYKAKDAFAEGKTVLHKDGKTEIKRVRIYQSTQIKTQKKLEKQKLAVRNKQGEIFKWFSYDNIHHVAIIHDLKKNEFFGEFVTMFKAHRRAMTGTKSAHKRGVIRESIIKTSYGKGFEFVRALHKQDIVSLNIDGKREYYQVKSLGQLSQGNQPRPKLLPHTCAYGKEGEVFDSIKSLMTNYEMLFHIINAIGKVIE